MATIWRLVDVCIMSILTYGAEASTATQAEIQQIQTTRDSIIKRILKTPITTPSEALMTET